jgi:hypothetical protein
MKIYQKTIQLIICISFSMFPQQSSWIRVNQLGYLPGDVKVAVFVAKGEAEITSFRVVDAFSGKAVVQSDEARKCGAYGAFASAYRLIFQKCRKPVCTILKQEVPALPK